MLWREYPLLPICLVTLPGIALGLAGFPAPGLLPLRGVLVLVFIFLSGWQWAGVHRNRRKIFSTLLFSWFFGFGLWRAGVHVRTLSSPDELPLGEQTAVGIVAGTGPPAEWRRIEVSPVFPEPSEGKGRRGNLSLYIRRAPELGRGDTLIFRAELQALQAPRNPEAFDFAAWLAGKGIYRQAFLREGEYAVHRKDNPISALEYLRKTCLTRLEQALPDREAYGVAAALILGHREGLDHEIRDNFQDAGAMHVLAVSGMHVGLVFLMLGYFLSPLERLGRIGVAAGMILRLAGIWLFIALAGMPSSARRAGLMFSFFTLGKLGHRQSHPLNTLALAALVLLFLDPGELRDMGFQLSFLALGGIICIQPALVSLWRPPRAFLDHPWQLICVSLAAQVATGPLCLYYFHQWPVYFLISGLAAVPLATAIMITGILTLAGLDIPFAGVLLGGVLLGLVRALKSLTEGIARLPGATWSGVWMDEWELGTALACVTFLAILCLSRRWVWSIHALLFLFATMVWHNAAGFACRKQKLVAVYYLKEHRLIDVFDGLKCTSLVTNALDSLDAARAAGLFRLSRKVRRVRPVDTSRPYSEGRLSVQAGLVQFERCIISLGVLPKARRLDVLVVGADTPLDSAWLHSFPPRLLILDNTLSSRQARRWEEMGQDLGLLLHNVNRDGALIFNTDLKAFPWQ